MKTSPIVLEICGAGPKYAGQGCTFNINKFVQKSGHPAKEGPSTHAKKNLGMNECSKERPSGIPNELNKDLADILTRLLQQNDRSYGFS